jgi:hypothetical protein
MPTPFQEGRVAIDRLDRYRASGGAEFVVLTGGRRVGPRYLPEEAFRVTLLVHALGIARTLRMQPVDVSRKPARTTGNACARDGQSRDVATTPCLLAEYDR